MKLKTSILFILFSTNCYASVDPNNSLIAYPYQDLITNNKTPNIVGFVKDINNNPIANQNIKISIDNIELSTVISDTAGAFSYEITQPQALSDGIHIVDAYAIESQINLNSVKFTVDTHIPNAPIITSPHTSDTIESYNITIYGSCEPYSTVFVKLDNSKYKGTVVAAANGAWSYDAVLDNGTHSVAAKIQNLAGTYSAYCDTITFEVDVSQ